MKFHFTCLSLLFFTVSSFSKTQVVMETSKGDIVLELFDDKAPITVKNFLVYVKEGFYNGTIFHRVINDFMIQGGGFTTNLKQKKTKDPIKNEASHKISNDVGTIAMARTPDPNSATSQFFINVKTNTFLNYSSEANPSYTVFGKVKKGMPVVNTIKKVATKRNGPLQNLPVENIIIKNMFVKKSE